jgi:hypothetical protein
MKKLSVILGLLITSQSYFAQTNPAITSWLRNTTGIVGSYYTSGNSTAMSNGIAANVQTVQYNATNVYISTHGIPAYSIGPYLDGNPNNAGDQNAIFKFPLTPVYPNTGANPSTTGGNIGVFINGVALFDYRDGVSWKNSTGTLCGGPTMCTGDGVWNRDAVLAERPGFDCAKGHPAGTNYHHHQNPSAFNLDLVVLSTVCNLYASNGLYVINPNVHSPLLGFAYDGFPIYGAFGYKNTDGTGGIIRMKSSYALRNITTRTTYSNGTTVTAGPAVSTNYPLGYFREDYQYVANSSSDYLDVHNGRFCVTPEYPQGTYAYFTTVDANYNSYYPYAVGPTFYGPIVAGKVTSVPTGAITYNGSALSTNDNNLKETNFKTYYNRNLDKILVQSQDILRNDAKVNLYSMDGKQLFDSVFHQGNSILNIEARQLVSGVYIVKITSDNKNVSLKILVNK